MIIVTKDVALGQMHWSRPTPPGMEIIGTVQRQKGSPYIWAGALMYIAKTGQYVEAIGGCFRTLSKFEVEKAINKLN
jgi:hypothetical protein